KSHQRFLGMEMRIEPPPAADGRGSNGRGILKVVIRVRRRFQLWIELDESSALNHRLRRGFLESSVRLGSLAEQKSRTAAGDDFLLVPASVAQRDSAGIDRVVHDFFGQ